MSFMPSYVSRLSDAKKRQREDECGAPPPLKRLRSTAVETVVEKMNGVVDFVWKKVSSILNTQRGEGSVQTIGGVSILPDNDGSEEGLSAVPNVEADTLRETADVRPEHGSTSNNEGEGNLNQLMALGCKDKVSVWKRYLCTCGRPLLFSCVHRYTAICNT